MCYCLLSGLMLFCALQGRGCYERRRGKTEDVLFFMWLQCVASMYCQWMYVSLYVFVIALCLQGIGQPTRCLLVLHQMLCLHCMHCCFCCSAHIAVRHQETWCKEEGQGQGQEQGHMGVSILACTFACQSCNWGVQFDSLTLSEWQVPQGAK